MVTETEMVTVLAAEAEFSRQQGKYTDRFRIRGNIASENEAANVMATDQSNVM